MRTIWKFDAKFGEIFSVSIPGGGTILSFQTQEMKPVLWVEVYPDEKPIIRRFVLFGTGHELGDMNLFYIGTTQIGPFVWHLYEVIEFVGNGFNRKRRNA